VQGFATAGDANKTKAEAKASVQSVILIIFDLFRCLEVGRVVVIGRIAKRNRATKNKLYSPLNTMS